MPQSAVRTEIAFRVQKRFNAPPEAVFRAWTDPEALKRWWCPEGWLPAGIEFDLQAGRPYRISMRRRDGGAVVSARGCFLEVQAPERLVYTWKWENAFEQVPETRVTVEFLAAGAGTMLVLRHEYLPEISVCLEHRGGWLAALDRLALIF